MSTATQTIIGIHVREYTETFPNEWELFQKAMREKLSLSSDNFGQVEGSDFIERKLFEMPETLYLILKNKLSVDDWQWFSSKEGAQWFAKAFPKFRTSLKT